MRSKIIWSILSCLMIAALVLASCTTTVEEEEEEEEGPPVTGANWWDEFGEPEYGGTITIRPDWLNDTFDPRFAGPFGGPLMQYESAFLEDWTLDREIWSFKGAFVPDKYYVGCLAESWEMTDAQTMVLHIREGVNWQDKSPVNGREFTADDVEYHYDRMLGTGSGFTEPSPFWNRNADYIKKVTATDKYTAVVEFNEPSALNSYYIMDPGQVSWIAPRETVEKYEDFIISDWRYAVGTGAWMVTDFISGSSATFDKNPNYWGYDERHPENRLPYANKLKLLCIPDVATALAALRTGNIDFITGQKWEQAESLARTNPDIQQVTLPYQGYTVDFRCDTVPFTDIKVRKALQMSIDRETIAETHYGGTVDGTPAGLISPDYKGYYFPYDEWPQELKDEYSYNPTKAKELLAEAGYPNGFNTNVVTSSRNDLELLQIIKAYLLDIDVDMEIQVMEHAAFSSFASAGKQDQMTFSTKTGCTFHPWIDLDYRTSRRQTNYSFNNDPIFDEMVFKLESTPEPAEVMQLSTDADRYAIEKHWGLQVCPTVTYNFWQPYLKGYSGETTFRGYAHYTRWWIDQDLKKSMGR